MSSKKKSASKQQKQHAKDSKSQKSPEFPFKTVLFLTIVAVGALIYSDIKTNGSWKESNTVYYLKKYQICEYSHKVLNKTSEGIKWVNSEIDKQFPGYEEKMHEILEPYGELFSNLGVISLGIASNARDAFIEVVGLLVENIEKHAPGALDKVQESAKLAISTSATYSKKSYDYLRNEFFTGKLAPEYVGGVILETLGSAQQKLNEFYVWASEKIRTVTK